MGRIIAIDYGTKRCGLAVTDPSRIIATALETVPTHQLVDYLRKYMATEVVDQIVIGEPKRLNNTDSETTRLALLFENQLQKTFPEKKICRYDERLTSKMAQRSLIESGQSKKVRRDKTVLDRVSATILLQDYLISLANNP
jgi:putative Holliday junction resolvase